MVLARRAKDLKLVPLYGVTYDLSHDFFKVSIKIAGRDYHCGYFDDANAAGHRADEVSVLLGTPENRNFDADGNPTGYDGSAVGHANLNLRRGNSRESRFTGIVTDKRAIKRNGRPYRAQVSVPDCRKNNRACPFEAAGAKCDCKPFHRERSTAFFKEEEAARAWNELVRKWGLNRMLVDPLVLNPI